MRKVKTAAKRLEALRQAEADLKSAGKIERLALAKGDALGVDVSLA